MTLRRFCLSPFCRDDLDPLAGGVANEADDALQRVLDADDDIDPDRIDMLYKAGQGTHGEGEDPHQGAVGHQQEAGVAAAAQHALGGDIGVGL